LALFISLVAWGFSSPIGSSPDDDYHLTSIWCGAGIREGLCEPGEKSDERLVPSILLEYPSCYAFKPQQSGQCSVSPSTTLVNSNRGNFDGSYPPLFYGTLSIFASSDIATSVLLMRAFNALLFVAVCTTLFFALPLGRRGPLLLGGLVAIVPLGMFLIPSVNPSSWAVTSAFTLLVALLGFFRAEERKRKVTLGVVALAMTAAAAGARSDAAVYSILAVFVAIVLSFTWSGLRNLVRVAIVPAVMVVIAAIFFLSSGQSSVVGAAVSNGEPRGIGSIAQSAIANLILLPELWVGALGVGGLGWLDTALPGSVWVSVLLAFFGLLFWGLRKIDRRKALALIAVFGALVAVPLYILVKDHVIVGAGVQPRYVYPLIVMLITVALLGFTRDSLKLTRVQLGCAAVLVIIANAIALHFNIRRYVTGTDVYGANLDSGVEWWWNFPISPMGVWLIGSVGFAIAVGGLYLYLVGVGSSRSLPRSLASRSIARGDTAQTTAPTEIENSSPSAAESSEK
jgi:hypothetical protein